MTAEDQGLSTMASSALRDIVGITAFEQPLALGRLKPKDPPASDSACCSRGKPLIAASADPFGKWFGDVTCVECAACSNRVAPSGDDSRSMRRELAVLILGHRTRLLLDTVLEHVIGATVQQGQPPATLFAYLENETMATPFLSAGGNIHGHPRYRGLSDTQLRATIAQQTREAGGRVGGLLIAPPPAAAFPDGAWAAMRLFHYTDARIKQTVAVALKKELVGYGMVAAHERRRGARFDWLLLLREDAHFFAPLQLARFTPHAVHGKVRAPALRVESPQLGLPGLVPTQPSAAHLCTRSVHGAGVRTLRRLERPRLPHPTHVAAADAHLVRAAARAAAAQPFDVHARRRWPPRPPHARRRGQAAAANPHPHPHPRPHPHPHPHPPSLPP